MKSKFFIILVVMIVFAVFIMYFNESGIQEDAKEDNPETLVVKEQIPDIPDIAFFDFVYINGKRYDFIPGRISDIKFLGEEIGLVKKDVAGELLMNQDYELKDGDATFLDKGTQLFEIKGAPEFIAASTKDKINGYAIYQDSTVNHFNSEILHIIKQKIESIEIYRYTGQHSTLLNTLTDLNEIETFKSIISNFEIQPQVYLPKVSSPKFYELVVYTDHQIAYTLTLSHDGTEWYSGNFIFNDMTKFIPLNE